MKCPKCEGEMEKGFIMDQSYGALLDQKWEKNFNNPVIRKVTDAEEVFKKENSESGFKVIIFRCKSCGFLESYAK